MKRAIVLALPSRIESFGLAVAEAMACGTPVVYSGIGPGPEVVEDGVSGLLVDPHSATDIAQKISRILGDTDLRRQLVSSALLRVSERFSLERCVDESIEFYDALLTARPR